MKQHPSYRLINQPLTYFGCERDFFLYGLGAAVFSYVVFDHSILLSFLAFSLCIWLGRKQAADPLFFPSILSPRYKKQYGAVRRKSHDVRIIQSEVV